MSLTLYALPDGQVAVKLSTASFCYYEVVASISSDFEVEDGLNHGLIPTSKFAYSHVKEIRDISNLAAHILINSSLPPSSAQRKAQDIWHYASSL